MCVNWQLDFLINIRLLLMLYTFRLSFYFFFPFSFYFLLFCSCEGLFAHLSDSFHLDHTHRKNSIPENRKSFSVFSSIHLIPYLTFEFAFAFIEFLLSYLNTYSAVFWLFCYFFVLVHCLTSLLSLGV